MRNVLAHAATILAASVLSACQSEQPAFVYVSQPEIFTRSSLVQERATELSYLRGKLDPTKEPIFGIQGAAYSNVLQSLASNLTFSYNPAGGFLTPGGGGSKSNTSNGTGGGGGNGTSNNTNGTNSAPVNSITINNNPSPSTSGSNNSQSSNTTNSGSSNNTSSNLTIPLANTTESPLDVLSDQLAYRDAVNAAIKEKMLDDTHDLRGYTLYTLKFDLTVMSANEDTTSARPLVVIMEMDDSPWDDGPENSASATYANWVQNLNQEIQIETLAAENRLIQNDLKESDLAQILECIVNDKDTIDYNNKDLPKLGTNNAAMKADDVVGDFAAYLVKSSTQRQDFWKSIDSDSAIRVRFATAYWVLKKYKQGFSDAADNFAPRIADIAGGDTPIGAYVRKTCSRLTLSADPLEKSVGAFSQADFQGIKDGTKPDKLKKLRDGLQACVKLPDVPTALQLPSSNNQTNHLNYFFVNWAKTTPSGPDWCRVVMTTLYRNFAPRAYAIQPKEYAQNISDVSSLQETLNLSLTLTAAFSQASVGDTTSYLRQATTALQAIKRNPLAIGFGNGRHRFGWVLGPQFYIGSNGKELRVHTPVRHSFAAEVGVPAWWSGIGLKGFCYWVNDDGKLVPANADSSFHLGNPPSGDTQPPKLGGWKTDLDHDFFLDDGHNETDDLASANNLSPGEIWPPYFYDPELKTPGPPTQPSKSIFRSTTFVRLPTDPAAITTALLYANNLTRRQPSLDPPGHVGDNAPNPRYTLQATGSPPADNSTDQTLVIRGRDLWRNPQVAVGNTVASNVDIMADMGGIVAHFHYLPFPQRHGADNPLVDLTVSTSLGTDTLPRAVEIFPPPAAAKSAAFLSLPQHWALAGGPINFTIDPKSADPLSSSNAHLRIRAHGAPSGNWQEIAASPTSNASNTLTFTIPSSSDLSSKFGISPAPANGTPQLFDVDVAVPNAGAINSLLPAAQSIVIYTQDSDRWLKMTNNGSNITIAWPTSSSDPEHLLDAYPDLARVIAAATATPTPTPSPIALQTNPAANANTTVTTSALTSVISGANNTHYSVNVVWKDPTGTANSIPTSGFTITSNGTLTIP